MYSAKIILDSVNLFQTRLTTFELCYPRMVHSELLTHRSASRNSSSSRAIPTQKLIEQVEQDPALPVWWGKNQKGMQARAELLPDEIQKARVVWLRARDQAVASVKELNEIGLHKQLANRLIEPWMFITVVLSATDLDNLWFLRRHRDAQPEIKHVIDMAYECYSASAPKTKDLGEWHLPYICEEDVADIHAEAKFTSMDPVAVLKKISVARCARVSYLTHDGRRSLDDDVRLHDQLASAEESLEPGHWSPFEHVAVSMATPKSSGNFNGGWGQYRKSFPHEAGPVRYDPMKHSK